MHRNSSYRFPKRSGQPCHKAVCHYPVFGGSDLGQPCFCPTVDLPDALVVLDEATGCASSNTVVGRRSVYETIPRWNCRCPQTPTRRNGRLCFIAGIVIGCEKKSQK